MILVTSEKSFLKIIHAKIMCKCGPLNLTQRPKVAALAHYILQYLDKSIVAEHAVPKSRAG